MPIVTIAGTPISFPDSGTSPNWSEPVIEFAEAVQDALEGIVGEADVSPQVFTIDAYNPGSNINVPNLSFSTTIVRSAIISYSVYRSTSVASGHQAGTLTIVYDPNSSVGQKWETGHTYVGNASITFYVTDTGQVQMSTSTLSGINHQGKISYSAKSLLQNS